MSDRAKLFMFNKGGQPSYFNNIVSYWNMDGNANDIIGGLNGTEYGTITYPNGFIDKSVDFSADPFAGLIIPNDPSLNFGDSFTDRAFSLSLWVNFQVLGTSWLIGKRGEIGNSSSTLKPAYQMYYASGNFGIVLFDGSSSVFLQRVSAGGLYTESNKWYNIIYTYNGNSNIFGLNLYVDGVAAGSGNTSGAYVAMHAYDNDVLFGRRADTPLGLNGYLDEIVFFDRELTLEERIEIRDRGLNGIPVID